MRREILRGRSNRAATPLFRAFGGRLVESDGDAVVLGGFPGSHRAEWRVLSWLVPAVVGGAVFDGLWRLGGAWAAWLGWIPVAFATLHLLALALGSGSPGILFLRWATVLGLWSVWLVARGGDPPVRWLAFVWLGFAGLQGIGMMVLGWRRVMGVGGRRGVWLRWLAFLVFHLLMAGVWIEFGWLWGVAAGAGIGAVGCLGTFLPTSGIFGPVATRVTGSGPLLTIDDGPDPDDTPAILDLLDRHQVKAVFFVIGEKVRRHPELAREIVARGHELGNHTMTHPQASMWCAGPGRTRREIEDCSRVIEEVAGEAPRWFRAPVGHRNYFTHPVCRDLGMEVVAWSHRAFDTVNRDVERIVRKLTGGAGEGDILLVHEATPVAREVMERVLEVIAPLKPSTSRSDDY